LGWILKDFCVGFWSAGTQKLKLFVQRFLPGFFVILFMGLLENYKNQITALCEKYSVRSLYSFGSVNTQRFGHASDIDLVVDLKSTDPLEYADNYFELKFELEKLLKRPVDLLENKAIRNSFLRKNIDDSKILVYGG
jgi:predicted nucleotidyltransferase